MEEHIESQDSSKTDGESNTDAQVNWDELDYDSAIAKAREIEQKNRQLYARTKKAEEKAKSSEQPNGEAQPPEPKPQEGASTEDTWKKRMEFKTSALARNLDETQLDAVIKFAEGSKIDYGQAMDNPVIKTYLEQSSKEKSVADATPAPGNVGRRVEGKTWDEFVKGATKEEIKQKIGQYFPPKK